MLFKSVRMRLNKGIISYACYAVGYCDRGKRGAFTERSISYTRYAVRYGDRGKRVAIIERIISYTRYAVGYGDRGKRGAKIERPMSYARYASVIGDNTVFTTGNKCFRRRLNKAIACAVINTVAAIYRYCFKRLATVKRPTSYARYAVSYGDRGKRAATIERTFV